MQHDHSARSCTVAACSAILCCTLVQKSGAALQYRIKASRSLLQAHQGDTPSSSTAPGLPSTTPSLPIRRQCLVMLTHRMTRIAPPAVPARRLPSLPTNVALRPPVAALLMLLLKGHQRKGRGVVGRWWPQAENAANHRGALTSTCWMSGHLHTEPHCISSSQSRLL